MLKWTVEIFNIFVIIVIIVIVIFVIFIHVRLWATHQDFTTFISTPVIFL